LNGTNATNILEYEGNPNGAVSATSLAILLGSGTSIGNIWLKVTPGTTNNDWFQVLGG
jgi:hypothetical protein